MFGFNGKHRPIGLICIALGIILIICNLPLCIWLIMLGAALVVIGTGLCG